MLRRLVVRRRHQGRRAHPSLRRRFESPGLLHQEQRTTDQGGEYTDRRLGQGRASVRPSLRRLGVVGVVIVVKALGHKADAAVDQPTRPRTSPPVFGHVASVGLSVSACGPPSAAAAAAAGSECCDPPSTRKRRQSIVCASSSLDENHGRRLSRENDTCTKEGLSKIARRARWGLEEAGRTYFEIIMKRLF
jgi:hypothetical protein